MDKHDRTHVMQLIAGMREIYKAPPLSDGAMALFLSALEGVSLEMIQRRLVEFLRSDARFPPTPGDLMDGGDPMPQRIPVSEIGKQAVEDMYAKQAEQQQRAGSVPPPADGAGV